MTPELPTDQPTPERPARQRLPATVRVTQILDAALRVFSDKGFAAARMDDVAAAAGLSKGGVYTHFTSKEEIFGALLTRLMLPLHANRPPLRPDTAVTVDVLVDQVVAPMYESFGDPATALTLRLMLADGARAQQLVGQWREMVVEPYLADIEQLLQRGAAQGHLRRGVLLHEPRLVLSPGVHSMLELLVQGQLDATAMERQRKSHIAMLRELLEP